MKAMRVLLVDENAERAGLLKSALHESGYTVSLHVGAMAQLLAQVRAVEPDVIIIDRDSPDRDTLEHVCMVTRDQPRPIVMFADDGDRMAIRAAVDAGVSAYVVGGLKAERIRPIVDVAIARFEQFQAMRQELDQTKTNLAERKQIERAKGMVMKSRGVSEEEAYGLLRKLAMERNQRIAQVSENVIAMAELLT
jgi:response regulator NasT